MDNKNTFPFKTNIVIYHEPVDIIPETGDEFLFVVSEEDAMKSVVQDHDKLGSFEEVYNSRHDELLSKCTQCNPVIFNNKKFGVIGYRHKTDSQLDITVRKFYLYEMT